MKMQIISFRKKEELFNDIRLGGCAECTKHFNKLESNADNIWYWKRSTQSKVGSLHCRGWPLTLLFQWSATNLAETILALYENNFAFWFLSLLNNCLLLSAYYTKTRLHLEDISRSFKRCNRSKADPWRRYGALRKLHEVCITSQQLRSSPYYELVSSSLDWRHRLHSSESSWSSYTAEILQYCSWVASTSTTSWVFWLLFRSME